MIDAWPGTVEGCSNPALGAQLQGPTYLQGILEQLFPIVTEVEIMKNLIFAVALSWALVLPALPQQANPAAPNPDTVREPLPPPTPRDFWDGDDPNFGNLILHPWARKAWVKRQTEPIKSRIDELDDITAEDAGRIRDIDARSKQGLQLASEKVSLADQHAADATNKAQTANLAATDATARVSTAEQRVDSLDQFKAGALTEIRFRPGQTLLSKQAKDALDQMALPLKNQQGYVIEVRGFSPGQGQTAIEASQKMADSVVRYLVLTHNIPPYRIYTLGMGNTSVAGDAGTMAKQPARARVEVSLLKNDLATTAHR
jgi:outer membrane protein OmpA-like peptidoglycan-associated protein